MPGPSRGVPLSPTSASGYYIPTGMTGDGGMLNPNKPCCSLRSEPSHPPSPHPHALVYRVKVLVMGVASSGGLGIYLWALAL